MLLLLLLLPLPVPLPLLLLLLLFPPLPRPYHCRYCYYYFWPNYCYYYYFCCSNCHRYRLFILFAENTPNCTTTLPDDGIVIEGQYYTAECSLSYNGDIVPIQTWSGPDKFNVGSSQVPNSIWSGVSWIANRTMDTRNFECLHNFTNNFLPATDEDSDYVPDWSYLYKTNQMFVYCKCHRWGHSPVN